MNETNYKETHLQFFESLLSEYASQRKTHMRKHWENMRSPFGKLWGQQKAYEKLRNDDVRFSREIQSWFSSYLDREAMDHSELKDYVTYLKNHNLRLADRRIF